MRRFVMAALAALLASGCSGVVEKRFKVFTDPGDAVIRVVSGTELKELKYRAPVTITAEAPTDPALAAKAILEVSRENYKSKIIPLSEIKDNGLLNIKLEKDMRSVSGSGVPG
jgi:hypothetical protein